MAEIRRKAPLPSGIEDLLDSLLGSIDCPTERAQMICRLAENAGMVQLVRTLLRARFGSEKLIYFSCGEHRLLQFADRIGEVGFSYKKANDELNLGAKLSIKVNRLIRLGLLEQIERTRGRIGASVRKIAITPKGKGALTALDYQLIQLEHGVRRYKGLVAILLSDK